ncbi:hypothetical protein ASD37_29970 [Mycobacterium sp. Root135]|uniref:helix-turn-helix domain-containing protein n=1 Tax=Mycobacterium sp. Root135 TaxID=1736457 RepID=UPI0006F76252|nr:hypothetical protein ASD37_29970 [Mycobacterium sp. Root135]
MKDAIIEDPRTSEQHDPLRPERLAWLLADTIKTSVAKRAMYDTYVELGCHQYRRAIAASINTAVRHGVLKPFGLADDVIRWLDAGCASSGLSTTEAATAAGLPRPTAHRLQTTLDGEGMVDRNAHTGRWSLGPELYLLGASASSFRLRLCAGVPGCLRTLRAPTM